MTSHPMPIKRLNATLPIRLAEFVAKMTGEDGLYETPSEFVRDLIRRNMEKVAALEQDMTNKLLRQSLAENNYSDFVNKDIDDIINSLE